MIETQLAQIAASLPVVESGKIPGQPESPVENVSMVSTERGNSSRRPPRNNHAGRYTPPRNDVWDGMVAAVQEDPGVPIISCSIYIKNLIFGRPFLRSAKARIDVGNGEIHFRVGREDMFFRFKKKEQRFMIQQDSEG